MTERTRLADALAARPREREYATHDTTLQGFMLRVQPNGAWSWVFRFRRDGKLCRVTLGKPGALKADQARAAALAFLARGRRQIPSPSSFRPYADEVRRRIRGPALARLEAVNAGFSHELSRQRDPARSRPSLGRRGRARFFHEYGRRKPGGANRCHEILRTMFDCAIAWGHRPETAGNSCTSIARYRRPLRGRLLGADDLAKLGAAETS